MFVKISGLALMIFLSIFHAQSNAQTSGKLPRSTPEEEGMPASAISRFIDSVNQSKNEFHSFMFLRHGKVIAEGWWNPYRSDLKHTLYSLSKSFTATAVGFAKAEGKLALSDKVISFFPSELPDTVNPYLEQLTIKDLLTMSVGQEPDPTSSVVQDSNWVKRFLSLPIRHQPGSTFLYNSMATYMLSAIVQKQTGKKIIDYLQPRLFEPLGINGMDWETDPKGINTGGWGLRLKTEDIAKFAQLFLQKGKWKRKQILPSGWVEEASTTKIIQHPAYSKAKRDSSDWEQGYCYQMWRCRNNSFRGDGAFGQYAIVIPDQDAVIAITSETPDMQNELNLIWKILLPAMQKGKLRANNKADAALHHKLASLTLPVKNYHSSTHLTSPSVTERSFVMESNPQKIQSLTFRFQENSCQVLLKTDTANYTLHFGLYDWQNGKTTLRGPYLVSNAKNSLTGLPPFKVAGKYAWLNADTLELVLRYIESPHRETILCHFNGNKIVVEIKRSFIVNVPEAITTIQGVIE